jgi:predicted N-acetyltransferase YhbS
MSQPTARPAAPILKPQHPHDAQAIEALLDRAFGPGRFTKVSERVREFAEPALELSVCAWAGERLVGVVRQWRVRVGGQPVVFLGPLAVDADQRGEGLGARLVSEAARAAETGGEAAVLLVGDAPFFSPLGFSAEAAREVVMPGPVDPTRVLAWLFRPVELKGPVRRL